MLISEIFYTLQGEGFYCGCPSIFIRTSGCNLRCNFCDTYYTSWFTEGGKKTPDEIIKEIYDQWGYVKHVVISGGEPTIQKDLPELVDKLIDKNHIVTIETNGTIYKENLKPSLFSISPKTNNSIPDETKYPKEAQYNQKQQTLHIKNNKLDNLHNYIKSDIPYQIKFVTIDENDLQEIDNIVDEYSIPSENVYLMPEGFTKESQEKRALKVAEICKDKKYIFCPRIHVELWGNKRGV